MDGQNPNSSSPHEQLAAYIQQQLHSGLQPNEVAGQLRQAGWGEPEINQAFQVAQARMMPTPVASGQSTGAVVVGAQPASGPIASQPISEPPRRGRIKAGWLLFKQSIKLLRSDKTLIKYVVASTCYCILLFIIFIIVLLLGHHVFLKDTTTAGTNSQHGLTPAGYVLTLVYYVLAYFIVNYYSAGLAANVLDLFKGQKKHYSEYMQIARSKAATLLVFSLIEATVGMILRAIAERSKLLGRIVVNLVGAAWSIARLFVVPIIVTSDDNAVVAIKDSTKLLISTWGENIVGRVSLGGVIFLIDLFILLPLAIVILIVGGAIGGGVGVAIAVAIIFSLFLIFSIVASTASLVLNVALFYFAQNKQIPPAFDASLINSFIHKKQRSGLLGRKTA